MTCKEFKQSIEAIFGHCEWKATKDNQVFQSKGWKEITYKYEINPLVMNKLKGKK